MKIGSNLWTNTVIRTTVIGQYESLNSLSCCQKAVDDDNSHNGWDGEPSPVYNTEFSGFGNDRSPSNIWQVNYVGLDTHGLNMIVSYSLINPILQKTNHEIEREECES